MARTKVFLVPGFLGFDALEGISYFRGVSSRLRASLEGHGVEADVIETGTRPTGSMRRRADRLLQRVIDEGGLEADALHFVGHSTGGLDVRLLLSPGVRLRPGDTETRIGALTRSAVCVSTPHYGTPVASFFYTAYGRVMLDLVRTVLREPGGRIGLYLAARAAALLASGSFTVTDVGKTGSSIVGMLSDRVLGLLGPKPDSAWQFLSDVSSDFGLVIQLTPEAMDLFETAVTDHPRVAYSSLASGVRVPVGALGLADLRHPDRVVRSLLFLLLYAVASQEHTTYPYPRPAERVRRRFAGRLPFALSPSANDGVVPTLSQLRGRVLDVVLADHLDVIGHFRRDPKDRFDDWFRSGAAFDAAAFDRVWDKVAAEIAGTAPRE